MMIVRFALALLFTLALPWVAFGQQTAQELFDSGYAKNNKGDQ